MSRNASCRFFSLMPSVRLLPLSFGTRFLRVTPQFGTQHWPHYTAPMADVTKLLEAIEKGEPQAANSLLPVVYDELRKLAAAKLVHEKPGQTLQATALVHEAYLRLVGEQDKG